MSPRRTSAALTDVSLIRSALRSIPATEAISEAVVKEGVGTLDLIDSLSALDRPTDAPDLQILRGRLRAVLNILYVLGHLPPELAHLTSVHVMTDTDA